MEKVIGFTPESLGFALAPDGKIVIQLMGMEKEMGLTPGIRAVIVLDPDEARAVSDTLSQLADAAEGKES